MHQAHAQTEEECLAKVLYNEARGETLESQYSVAHVALNRSKDPYFKADTLCEVAYKKSQFSGIKRWNNLSEENTLFKHLKDVAQMAITLYNNGTLPGFDDATYFTCGRFHNPKLLYLGKIGGHFYYKNRD